MALRLAAALRGSAQSWLTLQSQYDHWHAAKSLKCAVAKIAPLQNLTYTEFSQQKRQPRLPFYIARLLQTAN